MLKLGTQNIAALHLGGEQISKAYLGEAVVFGAGTPLPSRLPKGYAEVEYIYFTARTNSVIKTGYLLTGEDTVYLTYEETNLTVSRGAPFVAYELDTQRATMYVSYSSSSASGAKPGNPVGMMSWNAYTAFTSMVVTGEKVAYTISFPQKTLSAEFSGGIEEKQNVAMANPKSGTSLCLLGDSIADTSSIGYCPVGRLYSCIVTDSGGRKKAEFVPCIDPSGTIGLYDTVSGNFSTKVSRAGVTSTLAAGPTV